jgi:hypothetical protein
MEAELIKTVQDLIQFTKDVSPEVWKILIWQQYVISICIGIGFLVFPIAMVIGNWIYKGEEANESSIDLEFVGGAVVIISGVLFGICLLVFFVEGLPRLLNADYYALMALKP